MTGLNDNHGDTFATATIAEIGNGFSGQINATDDVDFFRIDLTSQTVALRFYDAPVNVSGTVFRSDGSIFATLTNDEQLWVNESDAEQLYFRIEGADQDTYQVDFGEAPEDVPANITTAEVLHIGSGGFSYSHGLTDQDWFRVITGGG